MTDFAIRIENIGKQYRIGARQPLYKTLRDTITNTVCSPFRRLGQILEGKSDGAANLRETIWALRDVSFEIRQGEVVGIIGRNGAGKSTLFKILSRITEPTIGGGEIRGRVGSLLEVGTGFHHELTGRENLYLNGAILGMKKVEIDRQFDEIVAFAEVEKFIDTPVKHYSSGMYLRLAFAVAAHLKPEILLVDEVLAVGDAAFQKKCLNKMEDVGKHGRTVLFVSHNMAAVTRLCERAILLDQGTAIEDGPSHEIVGAYLNAGFNTTAAREWIESGKAPGNDIVRLRAVRVRSREGRIAEAVDIRQPVGIEMEYEVFRPGYRLLPHFSVHNQEGVLVFVAMDQDPVWRWSLRPPGRYVSTGWIPGNLLTEGTLFIGPAMRTIEPDVCHFHEYQAIAFQVIDSLDCDTARGDYRYPIPGVVRPLLEWNTRYAEAHCSSGADRR